jgi:hypothetical protein
MKSAWVILLAILLAFSAAVSAAPAAGCCPDEDCGIVQCVEMGCLPAAVAMAPPSPELRFAPAGGHQGAAAPACPRRIWTTEVWTPPD